MQHVLQPERILAYNGRMKGTRAKPRVQPITVQVRPGIKEAINATAERKGMFEIELVTRVLLWFARLDSVAQQAIIETPDDAGNVLAHALMKETIVAVRNDPGKIPPPRE